MKMLVEYLNEVKINISLIKSNEIACPKYKE